MTTRNYRLFTILAIICFFFTSAAIVGCATTAPSPNPKEIIQKAVGAKEVVIPVAIYKADLKNSRKAASQWMTFFKESGIFDVRLATKGHLKGKAFICTLKEGHHDTYSYRGPKNPEGTLSPKQALTVGELVVDKVDGDFNGVDKSQIKYWARFEPNDLGALLLKHGLGEKLRLHEWKKKNAHKIMVVKGDKNDDRTFHVKHLGGGHRFKKITL